MDKPTGIVTIQSRYSMVDHIVFQQSYFRPI